MTNPPEEVTVPRTVVLEVTKAVVLSLIKGNSPHGDRVQSALSSIAAVTAEQSKRAVLWLLPAEPAWIVAHAIELDEDDPAAESLTTMREAIAEAAPFTCRSLKKQRELDEV